MALLQENIVQVGRLYDNIGLKHLAELFNVEENLILEAIIPLFIDGIIPGRVSLVDNMVVFKMEGMGWKLLSLCFVVFRIRFS
jgi:hypothetical protein